MSTIHVIAFSQVRIVTFANGHEVGDIIDMPKALSMPEVHLFVKNGDTVIKMADQDDGLHLANIYLFNNSYDRCMELLTEITDQILKKRSSTPPGVIATIVETPASDDDDVLDEVDAREVVVVTPDGRKRARRGSFFTLPSRYDVEPVETASTLENRDAVNNNKNNLLGLPFTASPVPSTIAEEPESPGEKAAPDGGSQPLDEGHAPDVTPLVDGSSTDRSPLQIANATANVKVRLTGAQAKQTNPTDAVVTNRKPAINMRLPPVLQRQSSMDDEAYKFGSSMALGQRLTVEIPASLKPRVPGKQVNLAAPSMARPRLVNPVVPGGLSKLQFTQPQKPVRMAIGGQHGSSKQLTEASKLLKRSGSDTDHRHGIALRDTKEKQRHADLNNPDAARSRAARQTPAAKDSKVTFADRT